MRNYLILFLFISSFVHLSFLWGLSFADNLEKESYTRIDIVRVKSTYHFNEKKVFTKPESDEVAGKTRGNKKVPAQTVPADNDAVSVRMSGNIKISYPYLSRIKKEEGTVEILVEVSEAATLVSLISSSGFARLDKAAISAFRKVKFKGSSYSLRKRVVFQLDL